MARGSCFNCGLTASLRSFYSLNGKTYCEPCVRKAASDASETGAPSNYISLTDNSRCARCKTDSPDASDYPLVGKMPFCPKCAPLVTDWPYPEWLKKSLVGLLILLAVAVVHGDKYFRAGRAMYIGERLVNEQQFAAALPYLQETLGVAPNSDKAALLTAKAALEIGNIGVAAKAFQGHNHGRFEDENAQDFVEANALWNRAMKASDKADKAGKLEEQDGHAAEAAQLMHEAAALYPQASYLANAAEEYDAGAAYERKDYDAFLSIATKLWKESPDAYMAGQVSSALACKYAVTGEEAYRKQSIEMLEKARQLAQGNPDAAKGFDEYAERIRYRLDSRKIMSKQEYDRKFRPSPEQKKQAN
jgi:hypothetical protein